MFKKLIFLSWISVLSLSLQAQVNRISVTDADIVGQVVWTADNEYVLNGFVFVEDGETLTIDAGTVVRGTPGEGENASALIVARGGKIFANGTAENPVIFTALDDDLSDPNDFGPGDVGEWGGLVLLGRATLNSPEASGDPIEDNIEGIPTTEPRGVYGGSDDNDSSGSLTYVSVRHGGTNIGANNEINGVTFGGVGRGTKVEFVEVFANQDDGFEFFGGTVEARFLVAAYCGDDSFDWDQGYRGKGQFWFTQAAGDRGGEHDGDLDDFNNQPLSNPTIYNVTYLGTGEGEGDALKLRENTAGKYYNSIFAHFGDRAVDVEANIVDENDVVIGEDPTKNNITSGELDLRDNIFWSFGRTSANNSNSNAQPFFETERNNVFADPMFRNYTLQLGLDPRPNTGSPALNAGREEIADGFFMDVDFKGAFGEVNWAAGWTIMSDSGYLTIEGAGIPNYPLANVSDDITISGVSIDGNTFKMTILAESGKTYAVQSTNAVVGGTWTTIQTVTGQGAAVVIEITLDLTNPESAQFFQVVIQ
ncbi:MAG: T9SS C-terminal target domain-containing protein [Verrucomicrobia bacterium]|nr:T9SS C-terminal target domain-containing protein [Verrucomicrobiota bacterium]